MQFAARSGTNRDRKQRHARLSRHGRLRSKILGDCRSAHASRPCNGYNTLHGFDQQGIRCDLENGATDFANYKNVFVVTDKKELRLFQARAVDRAELRIQSSDTISGRSYQSRKAIAPPIMAPFSVSRVSAATYFTAPRRRGTCRDSNGRCKRPPILSLRAAAHRVHRRGHSAVQPCCCPADCEQAPVQRDRARR